MPQMLAPQTMIASMIRERLLAGASPTWRELMAEFEDEDNYLSLGLACERGSMIPMLSIEFGVQDADTRRAAGILLAHWRRPEQQLGALETLLLDREPATLAPFAERLSGYFTLPLTHEEVADHAA